MVVREGEWQIFGFHNCYVTIMVLPVNTGCTLSPSISIISGEGLHLGVQGPEAVLHVEHLGDPLQAARQLCFRMVCCISLIYY